MSHRHSIHCILTIPDLILDNANGSPDNQWNGLGQVDLEKRKQAGLKNQQAGPGL